jgi:peptidoglycan/LPS O-acetylase OafA/YrhL
MLTAKQPSGRDTRNQALDVLRAVAILLVFSRHMKVCPAEASQLLSQTTQTLAQGGWIGVDLFFVLSGFLISGLLFREYKKTGTVSPVRFLIRRGFKIYPAFFVFLVASVSISYYMTHTVKWKGVLTESLFLTSYLRTPALFNHTWSLGVEEHFYIFLPVLFLGLVIWTRGKDSFRFVPKICVGLAIACLMARLTNHFLWPQLPNRCVFQSHCRFDSLFFGVLLAFFANFKAEAFKRLCICHRKKWLLAGAICYTPAFIFPLMQTPAMLTFGFTVFTLGGGFFLMGALGRPASSNLIIRCLAFMGAHSYSIYLWHEFVAWRALQLINVSSSISQWSAYFFCYVAGSILLGIFMAKAVEFPGLIVREKLFPSQT